MACADAFKNISFFFLFLRANSNRCHFDHSHRAIRIVKEFVKTAIHGMNHSFIGILETKTQILIAIYCCCGYTGHRVHAARKYMYVLCVWYFKLLMFYMNDEYMNNVLDIVHTYLYRHYTRERTVLREKKI